MIDDEFLKERADIRAKMLKYSRAVNEGKRTDEILAPDEIARPGKSDNIFQIRLEKDKKAMRSAFDENKKDKLYLPESLTNIKLEEKSSFAKKLFGKFKRKKSPLKPQKKPNAPKTQAENATKANPAKAPQANTLKANTPQKNLPNMAKMASPQTNPPNSAKPTSPQANLPKPNPAKIASPQSQEKPIQEIKTNPQTKPLKESEDNIKAKNVLLQGHSKATQDEKNLGKNQLLFAALCLFFAVVVFVPKVYITSNIYYLSRDIAILRTQESVLSEENKELNKKLENMRFQNQVLDYLE